MDGNPVPDCQKLIVENLSRDINKEDVKIVFEKHGKVINVELKRLESGKGKVMGVVWFSSEAAVERVLLLESDTLFPVGLTLSRYCNV